MSETKAVLCQTCGHMHERVQECQQPSNHSVCSAEHRAQLWDAINEYAEACGATPGARIYGNTKRQRAVAEIEALVYPINEKGQS